MANIRLKDLTSVENIADTDVIVIDGEAGTRVTTWAKMKELIKAQCGINELNTNMESSGINDERLSSFSIGSTLSVEELLGKPTVTFFTNWLDTVNFPEIYGSGILIPGLDSSNKFLIYISSNSIIYAGFARATAGGIIWKRVQLE